MLRTVSPVFSIFLLLHLRQFAVCDLNTVGLGFLAVLLWPACPPGRLAGLSSAFLRAADLFFCEPPLPFPTGSCAREGGRRMRPAVVRVGALEGLDLGVLAFVVGLEAVVLCPHAPDLGCEVRSPPQQPSPSRRMDVEGSEDARCPILPPTAVHNAPKRLRSDAQGYI